MLVLKNNKDVVKVVPTMVVECQKGVYTTDEYCHSLLEIESTDIKIGHFHIADDDAHIYYYVTCPVCGAVVEVDFRTIPTEIRKLM